MGQTDNMLEQLERYLLFMKMSGVQYLPKATQKDPAVLQAVEKSAIQERPDVTHSPDMPGDTLEDIRKDLGDCTRCGLSNSRTTLVFGTGSPNADLLFVGEAPGGDEDIKGEPFVGEAGKLLTKIIEAIKLRREDVYICNVLKCRPSDNRNPLPEEIDACKPFLERQIRTIRPKVICALGKFATQTLLDTQTPISSLRGRFHNYKGIPLMPTYHPAYLLRNPNIKREVWEDMKQIKKMLDEKA
jgi:DNA polymerase